LEELDPLLEKTDSDLEALMLRTVWTGALPRPTVQYVVRVNGRTRRLDFAYPRIKLGIEADGYEEHGKREGFERDRDRDPELEAEGWLIMRFTWRQVRHRPEWVVEKIAAAYKLRTALFVGDAPA
jgi:very-short-patch-repair endonuclease